jgi:hypothetical protein
MMNALAACFILIGSIFLSLDMILPFIIPPSTNFYIDFVSIHSQLIFPLELMGIIFVCIGLVVFLLRSWQTGTSMFHDLPNSRVVPLIHSRNQGLDPDASFMKGIRLDLEVIRAKGKLIKDTGGGFRIGGHGCRRTYETIGFTVPEWLSEYLHKIKDKYGLKNSDEFRGLRKSLKLLDESKDKETQLKTILLLKPIMESPVHKKALLAMSWKSLKDMDEALFDGVTHNGDEVELFIDSATPNEQDILEHQTFLNAMDRQHRYRDGGATDWGKWMPWIIIMLIVVAMIFMMTK